MSELQNKIQKVLSERARNSEKILSQFKNAHALIEGINCLIGHIRAAQIDGADTLVSELETQRANIENALKKYAFLEDRIKRTDAIYIGLAGGSRAGKSTFIQALTGLPQAMIPKAEKGSRMPTTAVHSVIYNSPEREAKITFRTREEFEARLKEMLEPFGWEKYSSISAFVNDLNLDKAKIKDRTWNNLKISQEAFPYYEKLLGENESKTLTLKAEEFDKGKYYFTYMDKEKDVSHRFFPAVKEAKIFAKFNGIAEDAHIVLLDLPGFGETDKVSKDTIEKLKTVDFVLFVENTSSGQPHLMDSFWDSHRRIKEAISLNDTFKHFISFLLNRFENESDVECACNELKEKLQERTQHFVFDCAVQHTDESFNKEGVKSVFTDVADTLADTLPKMDEELNGYFQRDFNVESLSKLISDIASKLGDTDSSEDVFDFEMVRNISDEHIKKSKDKIISDLKNLSSDISDTMFPRDEEEKPLRGPLTNKLIKILKYWMWTDYKKELDKEEAQEETDLENLNDYNKFQIKNYEITPEILKTTKKTVKDLSGYSPNLQAIENYLRDNWNRKIKKDFDSVVIGLAGNEHATYSEQIKKIFIDGLEIDGTNEYKAFLEECVSKYLDGINQIDYKGYFKSLVDRFCDDVIGILIRKPFTSERVTFFNEKRNNFYTLACVDDGIDSTVSIEKQPLYPLILKHEDRYIRIAKWKSVLDEIATETGELTKDTAGMLIKRFIPVGDIGEVTDLVRNSLKNLGANDKVSAFLDRFDGRVTNDETISQESEYIYPDPKNEVEIQQQLNMDIKILNYVLIHSVVNAINLETPFAAYENNFIEEIVDELKDKLSFNQFVNKHFAKIKPGSDEEIKEKIERIKRISNSAAEVNRILTNIKSNK